MKLTSLLTLALATALLSVTAGVGCSEPDVAGFQARNAESPAGDDDDDDADDGPHTTSHDDDLDESTKPAKKETKKETPAKDAGTTTTEPTRQQCLTRCLSPVPEAAALDACTQKCSEDDTECLGGCYESSNCGDNPLCDQAIAQCGEKCPATS